MVTEEQAQSFVRLGLERENRLDRVVVATLLVLLCKGSPVSKAEILFNQYTSPEANGALTED
jgi:hypothetical protein